MILGRPTNLWLGLIAGAVSMLITIIGATQTAEVAQTWAIILGAIGTFLGLVILFVAGQAPTLNPGDTFTIRTPSGQPNATGIVTPPQPVIVPSDPQP